jgi:pimeloyl-ACP methyl ester carboxylesterase
VELSEELFRKAVQSHHRASATANQEERREEIGRYAEHVYSFLKALGLSKVFLVGHSMGGAIVQTLALTHPEVTKGSSGGDGRS